VIGKQFDGTGMPASGIVAFKPATIAGISCALQRRNTFGQVFLLVLVGFAARRFSYCVVPNWPKNKTGTTCVIPATAAIQEIRIAPL